MTDITAAAIIVAAGTGQRSGLDLPKQFASLGGRAVVAHSHAALAAHPAIAHVLVVVGEGQEELARAALGADVTLVIGGATRRNSVLRGLEALEAAGGAEAVLIHDAARPFVPAAVVDRLLAALADHEGAVPALPLADTLVRGQQAVERDGLHRVQTPQAFRFGAILGAHRTVDADAAVTDDAGLLRASGKAVALVEGDPMLEKLTYPADFVRAEALAAERLCTRVGTGFDVHRLTAGKELWLCGVPIPHDKGLSGHSDADVAIHALVDALLGALAEGDIGSHFPPSDPQWKGAPSHRFLTFARDRVAARGGRIAHADVTIVCEAPRIGPHREAMRDRLAELLGVARERVSVKATTTERLGFTGRGEGISAQAVATVLLPDL